MYLTLYLLYEILIQCRNNRQNIDVNNSDLTLVEGAEKGLRKKGVLILDTVAVVIEIIHEENRKFVTFTILLHYRQYFKYSCNILGTYKNTKQNPFKISLKCKYIRLLN